MPMPCRKPAGPQEPETVHFPASPALDAPGTDVVAQPRVATDEEEEEVAANEETSPLVVVAPKVRFWKLFSQMDAREAMVLALGVLGAMGHGLAQPMMVVVFGDLIDALGGGPADDQQETERLCLIMCAVGAVGTIAAMLQGASFKIFADSQTAKYRIMYFEDVLHQDVGWFDQQEVSGLAAEIQEDLSKIQEAFGDQLGQGVMACSAFLGGLACALGVGWLLALILSAVIPLLALGTCLQGRAVAQVQQESQGWYGRAAAVVEECLYGMRTVVAFGGEQRELAKFISAVDQTRKEGIRNGLRVGIGTGFCLSVQYCNYSLAFFAGMNFAYNQNINPATGEAWKTGDIMTIFLCLFIGSFMLGQINPFAKAIEAAQKAVGRFSLIHESQPAIQRRDVDERKELASIDAFVLDQVHFHYPTRPSAKILHGLSVTIQRGQKVAFVGESGSGKSTVMALLERFYDPSSGVVCVNGQDVRNFQVAALRRCIGYVGQEPVLFSQSIRENIMEGNPNATNNQFCQACADAQLDFVDRLPEKFNTFVGTGGGQLSGGEKQRIALARALLKEASFLFLDEATSALDNASERMIQQTIQNISSQRHSLGIVSIAHRLSTIQTSDLIYVLHRGRIVERGTHESLMERKGAYHALVAAQECSKEAEPAQDLLVSQPTAALLRATSPKRGAGEVVLDKHDQEKDLEEERQKDIKQSYKVPLSRLLAYNRQEWLFFVPALLGAAAVGCGSPLCALAMVDSMDSFFKLEVEALKEEAQDEINILCLLFLIIALVALVGSVFEHGGLAVLSESMTKRLRVAMLRAMFRQEIGFHDDPENTPGMLARSLELWAFRVGTLCQSIGAKLGALTSLLLGISIAFAYCWQMALMMLGVVPVIVAAHSVQLLVKLGASNADNLDDARAAQIVNDSIMNARTVQALGVEKHRVQKYAVLVVDSGKRTWASNLIAGVGFGIAGGAVFFVLAAGFYYASVLRREGAASFKDSMVAFIGVAFAGLGAGQAAVFLPDAAKAKVACHDMFKLLDRASKIDGLERKGDTPGKIDAGTIEFQDVKFFYPFRPEIQVLRGVSFQIWAGQSVGLVGPSGGGKSTVMSLIQRFYDPQVGRILIGQAKRPLGDLNIRWWRRQIGFVGQEPVLFNTTVRNNILYGLAEDESVTEDYIKKCEEICNLKFLYKSGNLGLATEVGPRGERLSGGQKQRVAICRALIRDPAVMLLDEATSALDSQSEAIVQKALSAAREGRTSFAVAHRLSTICDCDVILVNADGRVVESGTHNELMVLKGVYYKLQMQAPN